MHLIGIFSVVFSSPQTVFRRHFPILAMEGELAKNLVLLAVAGRPARSHELHSGAYTAISPI